MVKLSKTLIKYRNAVMFILLAEFIIAISISALMQSNYVLALSIYILVKNAIMMAIIYLLCRHFDQEQIDISTVLGEDVGNACIFGGIGLIMYDENRNIMWTSELFKELGMDLIGRKLLEWQPSLEILFEEESVKMIETNKRRFEVFNNASSRVLYLRDVTELKALNSAYHNERIVFGYLSIDNYDDTIASVDEQKVAMIQATIRNTISKWASDYGIVLRRFKSDGYILIFSEQIYVSLVRNKFDILETIKDEADKMGVVLTLSIGISRNYKTLKELEEMAGSALTLAFSRGGDQVVIKSMDEQVRFYGGNSEASSKNNKVRARVIAKTLRSLIKSSSNVIIMGHKQSDLDSFGGSLGMYKIIESYGVPANIVIDINSLEDKTNRVVSSIKHNENYQGLIVSPNRAIELMKPTSLLIVVDNHKPSLAIDHKVIEIAKNIVVIDHHRRGEEFINRPTLTYLEPAASSTVELISELFEYQDRSIRLTELEATIMYAGILVDTMDFKTRTGVRTFRVAALLKDMGANVSRAVEMLQDDYVFTLKKAQLVQNAIRYNERVLISAGEDQTTYSRVMLAKVGNELLEINETQASFVIGRVDESTVAISSRSNGKINVQVIMEKMGGGGHFSMAACQLKDCSVNDAKRLLVEKLDEYYSEREE